MLYSKSVIEAWRKGEGVLCVKVMTDEQMEVLRSQISAYATICEHLVEMHRRTMTPRQDSLSGSHLFPHQSSGGAKTSPKQRWTPTPLQVQILDSIFCHGNRTPSKQRIKEITSELSRHGQVSETSVYIWFQNRRASLKRKLAFAAQAEEESPGEKKAKKKISFT